MSNEWASTGVTNLYYDGTKFGVGAGTAPDDVVHAKGSNSSGRVAVKIENTASGGTGNASLQLFTDSGQVGVVIAQSSGVPSIANQLYIAGKLSAGTQIAAEHASGAVIVSAGGSERARVDNTSGLTLKPVASTTPANNGDLQIQATSNTSLTFKYKGSDGTVRSGSITLS